MFIGIEFFGTPGQLELWLCIGSNTGRVWLGVVLGSMMSWVTQLALLYYPPRVTYYISTFKLEKAD